MNIVATFLDTAQLQGDRVAITAGDGERISFVDLARRSGRLAARWQERGIRRGDRVLVAMPVGIELYMAIAALWRLGAVVVFPEPAMGLAGIRPAVEIAAPQAVLLTGIYRILPLLVPALFSVRLRLDLHTEVSGDPLEDMKADEAALISFTSGSTGRPKAIARSHGFLSAQNEELRPLLAPTRDDETDLVAFPVFVIANLALGVTSVLPNWRISRPDRAGAGRIAAHVTRHAVTRMLVQPSVAEIIATADTVLPIHSLFTGGGPVFPDLLQRLSARLPATDIVSVYGSTEAEPIAHQALADISSAQWTAMTQGGGLLAGRPSEGTHLRIIDDEIVVTGPHVNQSYLNGVGDADNKLHFDGHIWHRTGDAGRVDADGFLWLRGRLSARAGKLYPFEAEVAARSWQGVRRAALIPGSTPPALALEGAEPSPSAWQEAGKSIGVGRIIPMRIPLDRRHRSKVDYVALANQVLGAPR